MNTSLIRVIKMDIQVVFILIGSLVHSSASKGYCEPLQVVEGGVTKCREIYQMNCPKECFDAVECPQDQCYDVYAKRYHDHHVHDRLSQCPTCCCCEWRECPCGANRCELDAEGCPTSTCIQQHHDCPKKRFCPRDCNSGGQGGYRVDDWGCQTCECTTKFESRLFEVFSGRSSHRGR